MGKMHVLRRNPFGILISERCFSFPVSLGENDVVKPQGLAHDDPDTFEWGFKRTDDPENPKTHKKHVKNI